MAMASSSSSPLPLLALLLVSVLVSVPVLAIASPCAGPPASSMPFCNTSLDAGARAADLIARMTTHERIRQLGNSAPAIERLGLPAYQLRADPALPQPQQPPPQPPPDSALLGPHADAVRAGPDRWWSEALHGVASSPGVSFDGPIKAATSFPQVIGIAAAFNTTLVQRIAEATSTEARAFANQGVAGLTYYTPNINLFRDPRWGRGQETPGEDPYLGMRYVAALGAGLQRGSDPRYTKIVMTCKHYAAYDLEEYHGITRYGQLGRTVARRGDRALRRGNRHTFNAKVADRDLVESYLPAFEACITEAHGASVMCSYNVRTGCRCRRRSGRRA